MNEAADDDKLLADAEQNHPGKPTETGEPCLSVGPNARKPLGVLGDRADRRLDGHAELADDMRRTLLVPVDRGL
jgi:hypothetical protein